MPRTSCKNQQPRGLKVDISGKRVGMLTAYWPVRLQRSSGVYHYGWVCQCDCGKMKVISSGELARGKTISCGCWHDEATRQRMTKHGSARTSEYQIYHQARKRCITSLPRYRHYNGRGIEFRFSSFEHFIAEVGKRPGPQYSLDRIDNNGHYEPGNVRWATKKQQSANRRRVYITATTCPRAIW